MVIDAGESEILERAGPKRVEYAALGVGCFEGAVSDLVQKRPKLGGVHMRVRCKVAVLLTFENRPVNNNDLPR